MRSRALKFGIKQEGGREEKRKKLLQHYVVLEEFFFFQGSFSKERRADSNARGGTHTFTRFLFKTLLSHLTNSKTWGGWGRNKLYFLLRVYISPHYVCTSERGSDRTEASRRPLYKYGRRPRLAQDMIGK